MPVDNNGTTEELHEDSCATQMQNVGRPMTTENRELVGVANFASQNSYRDEAQTIVTRRNIMRTLTNEPPTTSLLHAAEHTL